MLIEKNGWDPSGTQLSIHNKIIESYKNIDLLGVTIENKLSFKKDIGKICTSATNKLNAIKWLPIKTIGENIHSSMALFWNR